MKVVKEAREVVENQWGIRWTEDHERTWEGKNTDHKIQRPEALVNGETYFFRYPFYMQVLIDELERKAEKYPHPSFRVLCAGCSTGEEAYTIAFTLLDRARHERCILEILGLDLRPAAVEKAKSGIYTSWSLRNMSLSQQRRFLKKKDAGVQVVEPYRSAVEFRVHNLIERIVEQPFDAILTCNVLLYMHEEAVRKAYANLDAVSGPQTLLITAPTDPPPRAPWTFRREYAGWPIYVRTQRAASTVSVAAVSPAGPKQTPKPAKPVKPPSPVKIARPPLPKQSVAPAVEPPAGQDQQLWDAWAHGKLKEATDQIRQKLFFEPEHPLWRFLNGVILWENGWLGKARKEIDKAHHLLKSYDPEKTIAGLCTAAELDRMIDFWRQQSG